MPTLYDETGKKIELPYTPEGRRAARAAQNAGPAPQAQPTKRPQNAANGPKTTRQQYQDELDRQKARKQNSAAQRYQDEKDKIAAILDKRKARR